MSLHLLDPMAFNNSIKCSF